jgi:hypothetical protein
VFCWKIFTCSAVITTGPTHASALLGRVAVVFMDQESDLTIDN